MKLLDMNTADDPDRDLWQGGDILDDEATPSTW